MACAHAQVNFLFSWEALPQSSSLLFSVSMEILPNNYQLEIPDGCFPLSTDSMVLSHFVRLPKNARVLDLGSGCGTLGLLLCSRDAGCAVTGIERDEAAHAAALANICRNGLENRLESLLADIQEVPQRLTPGSFDVCLSNPPYFSGGPAAKLTAARREDFCPVSALMKAAGWALKYGGDFYLVHRPERLGELIAAGAAVGLEAKRLGLVRHRPGDPVSLILLGLRKGGKPGLIWEEWILRDSDGSPTPLYREIYHLGGF